MMLNTTLHGWHYLNVCNECGGIDIRSRNPWGENQMFVCRTCMKESSAANFFVAAIPVGIAYIWREEAA